jgi:hypothetical protein
VGLEQGPLSLVSTIEELLGRKSSGSGLENREFVRRDASRWPRGTVYPQKVALTWPTSGLSPRIFFPSNAVANESGLHLDRKLTWQHHIFTKRKHLGVTLTKMYWLLVRKSQLSLSNKLLLYKTILKPIWTYSIRDPGTLPIESLAHNSRRTAVCAEHSYPPRPSDSIS